MMILLMMVLMTMIKRRIVMVMGMIKLVKKFIKIFPFFSWLSTSLLKPSRNLVVIVSYF